MITKLDIFVLQQKPTNYKHMVIKFLISTTAIQKKTNFFLHAKTKKFIPLHETYPKPFSLQQT